ncbi:sulfite exporter TauE/SafE family protein [Methyloferula stellata]|uniref:sulfite exporter TauE/SafE family protein n=1 Tax=Methyloferula stellata TaxID=876270 RepID=UPI0003A5A9A6|nr:sulfite exporter TauE/SafE family protein [Methyloferula stellata]
MSINSFAVICGSHGIAPAAGMAGLAGALFVAGLAGSVAHCGPMCGPLVIAQASNRLAHVPASRLCEMSRIRSGLLLPYHLGRLTTYAALGAAAALFGQTLSDLPWFRFVAAGLLIVAASLFIWQAVAPASASRPAALWSKLAGPLATRLNAPGILNTYGLGLLLGFIPCGLVYAALAATAATADPLAGAIGMIAFGLGTVPMLAAIGTLGQVAMIRMRRFAHLARPVILTLDGGLLLVLAMSWVT